MFQTLPESKPGPSPIIGATSSTIHDLAQNGLAPGQLIVCLVYNFTHRLVEGTFIHYNPNDGEDYDMDSITDDTGSGDEGDREDEADSEDGSDSDSNNSVDIDDYPRRPSRRDHETQPNVDMDIDSEVSDHAHLWEKRWESNAPRNRFRAPSGSGSDDDLCSDIGYSFGEKEMVRSNY